MASKNKGILFEAAAPEEVKWRPEEHLLSELEQTPLYAPIQRGLPPRVLPKGIPIWIALHGYRDPKTVDYYIQSRPLSQDWTVPADKLFWYPQSVTIVYVKLEQELEVDFDTTDPKRRAVGFFCRWMDIKAHS